MEEDTEAIQATMFIDPKMVKRMLDTLVSLGEIRKVYNQHTEMYEYFWTASGESLDSVG
jgi:DNA-binding HxlR family transcriptional regulator